MSYSDQGLDRRSGGGIATFEQSSRPDEEQSFSVIDQYSRFDGTFVAERDLRVDGEVRGTIDCHGTLFVAQGATVEATIEAENITVAGDLTGEINCRGRLRLMPSGRLKGKVRTQALVIAEGAIYDGELSMERGAASSNGASIDTAQAQQRRSSPPPRERSGTSGRRQPAPPASEPATPVETAVSNDPQVAPSTFIRRLGGPETPWDEPAEENNPDEADSQQS
jgi:cytoskeletal protein CcmA (bactofilin family)